MSKSHKSIVDRYITAKAAVEAAEKELAEVRKDVEGWEIGPYAGTLGSLEIGARSVEAVNVPEAAEIAGTEAVLRVATLTKKAAAEILTGEQIARISTVVRVEKTIRTKVAVEVAA